MMDVNVNPMAGESDKDILACLSDIELMIRIYYTPNWATKFAPDKFVDYTLERLSNCGLIELCAGTWNATERGRVYVEAIRSLPLPIQTWSMP